MATGPDDSTLARVADITAEPREITLQRGPPSKSSRSSTSSDYKAMAGRLHKCLSKGYRRRLSRSIEEISEASRSRSRTSERSGRSGESRQSSKKESDPPDSLASDEVFGSKEEQIKFLKETLIRYRTKMENYKKINLDLTIKLEKCRTHGKMLEKQLGDVLWDKLKLFRKYRRLQRRFGIPETPPGKEDSLSGDSSNGTADRPGTPDHRPDRRHPPTVHRKVPPPGRRPTVMMCRAQPQVEGTPNGNKSSGSKSDSLDSTSLDSHGSISQKNNQHDEDTEIEDAEIEDVESSSYSSVSSQRKRSLTTDDDEEEDRSKKRNKSSNSSASTHSGQSSAHSVLSAHSALSSAHSSRSLTPPPVPFPDAPRVFPAEAAGSRKLPRFWHRNGTITDLRSAVRLNYNDDENFDYIFRGRVI